MKRTIEVQGLEIRIEPIQENDYISLTDIAKTGDNEPRFVIQNWLKNQNTILYLWEWEQLHNPNLNRMQMHTVLERNASNRFTMSPKKWVDLTNAVGLTVKAGRTGGTFAHKDIALNFCYWLSPKFQIYFIKAFQELMNERMNRKKLEWDVKKITDNIEEIRNILDTIEGQDPTRNRLARAMEEE